MQFSSLQEIVELRQSVIEENEELKNKMTRLKERKKELENKVISLERDNMNLENQTRSLENKVSSQGLFMWTYEPRCEKTGLWGFRPGPTQTRLYNHRR